MTRAPSRRAKAAQWPVTNSLRVEPAGQGTQVSSLHVGYLDTDLIADLDDVEKADTAEVARIALDGVARGQLEVDVIAPPTSTTFPVHIGQMPTRRGRFTRRRPPARRILMFTGNLTPLAALTPGLGDLAIGLAAP
ncbi:hypothetical protein ABZU76_14005 [Amycolatopsis sp. NPDC005232]|uniref:hypothetical protein n=1 Tax=Amycolatopsis sp. NPDC005232 TaxID=3157027 RepID=UPI0033A56187